MRAFAGEVRVSEWASLILVLLAVIWAAGGGMSSTDAAIVLFGAWLQLAGRTVELAVLRWSQHRILICAKALEEFLTTELTTMQRARISGLVNLVKRNAS